MPPKTGTKVKLDKNRTIRFRARAWEQFEATTGRNVIAGEMDDLTFSDLVTLVWCGCLDEEPDLPRDTILDALDMKRFAEIDADIKKAIEQSLPQQNGDGEKKGAAKKS